MPHEAFCSSCDPFLILNPVKELESSLKTLLLRYACSALLIYT